MAHLVSSLQFAADNNLSVEFVNYALDHLRFEARRDLHALNSLVTNADGFSTIGEINNRVITETQIQRNARPLRARRSKWDRQNTHLQHNREFPPESRAYGKDLSNRDYVLHKAQLARRKGEHLELTTGEIVKYLRLRQNISATELGTRLAAYEDALPNDVVSRIESVTTRKRGEAFSYDYISLIENNERRISGQRLNNLLLVLSASPDEVTAVMQWGRRPRLAELNAAASYAECLRGAYKLKWNTLKNFVSELNSGRPVATEFSYVEITRMLAGETLPTVKFHEACVEFFAKRQIPEFSQAINSLREKSAAFFRNLMETSQDCAEFIILCRLSLNLGTREFADKLKVNQLATACSWENGTRAPLKHTYLDIISISNLDKALAGKLTQLVVQKRKELSIEPKPPAIRKEVEDTKFKKMLSQYVFLPTSLEQLAQLTKRAGRNHE